MEQYLRGTTGTFVGAIDAWLVVERCPGYHCMLGTTYFTYVACIKSTLLSCNKTQWMVNEPFAHTYGFNCNLGFFGVLRLVYNGFLWVVLYDHKLEILGSWRVKCLKMCGSIFPAKSPFAMLCITHPNFSLLKMGAPLFASLCFLPILFSFALQNLRCCFYFVSILYHFCMWWNTCLWGIATEVNGER